MVLKYSPQEHCHADQTDNFCTILCEHLDPQRHEQIQDAFKTFPDNIACIFDELVFDHLDLSDRKKLDFAYKSLVTLGKQVTGKAFRNEGLQLARTGSLYSALNTTEVADLRGVARLDWPLSATLYEWKGNWDFFLERCVILVNHTDILSLFQLERWRANSMRKIDYTLGRSQTRRRKKITNTL